MSIIEFEDLGMIPYKKAWEYQGQLFNNLIRNKNSDVKNKVHKLLFCEHPHVFTLGKNGNVSNLLINKELLSQKQIEFFHIDRGGDITYHGPGQQVVYPIFDLDEFGINTREYVYRLEKAVIQTLSHFNIQGRRLNGAAGIWLDNDKNGKESKICAIGVKSSQRITMHGIALNVNTDLDFFSLMNPCGFTDKGVTSMQNELGHLVEFQVVKEILRNQLEKQFVDYE